MKAKLALLPLAVLLAGASVVAFHPGVAYAAPRLAAAPRTPMIAAATYAIDPMHTSVSFEIEHMGLSKVHGRIDKFSGRVVEDPDLAKASVEFTGEIASIDTAVPARDKHIQAPDYFDAEKYPTLSFKSTKVAKAGEDYVVTGDLTIKGVSKSVAITFSHRGPVEAPGTGPARVGVIAQPFTIKRTDFGIGKGDKMPNGVMPLSDEVVMRLSLEATKEG